MSHWSFYFLAKVALHYAGAIGFHWLPNLMFALALLWPLHSRRLRALRSALAWPLAAALLYHDAYLPPIGRLLAQLPALAALRLDYLAELLARVVAWQTLLLLACAFVLYALLARRIRFATFALAAILSVPVVAVLTLPDGGPPGAQAARQVDAGAGSRNASAAPETAFDPDAELRAFYARERRRRVSFEGVATPAPFDIIVLHVCSLSWDDLDYLGLRDLPLLKRFDAVFTQFNSAASYSGPASLRLLRGNCGQVPHGALYERADPACYVFPSLERLGYRTAALLNHDGSYDDFARTLQTHGGMAGKIEPVAGAPVRLQSFDGSPVYSDLGVLSRWLSARQATAGAPIALYYNSVTLHDGNRIPGAASQSSLEGYKPRLQQLLADLDRFLTLLEGTGRPTVLLLVPEHGAALRAGVDQIAGLRETPGPRITLVPAAMKLVGMRGGAPAGQPFIVKQPISYLGLNALLADLLRDSPLEAASQPLAQRLGRLETTAFEAENGEAVVLRSASGTYFAKNGAGWTAHPY